MYIFYVHVTHFEYILRSNPNKKWIAGIKLHIAQKFIVLWMNVQFAQPFLVI